VPAAGVEMREEGMGCFRWVDIFSVKGFGQYPDLRDGHVDMFSDVETILYRQEHGTCGKHDGWIVDEPRMVEGAEVVDGLLEKRVALFGEHEVVGNSDRDSLWKDDGVYKKRVNGTPTADVEIHVNAAIMIEDEVADSVSTLDGISVVVERVQEPWIMGCNEFARAGIRPEHVLAGLFVRGGRRHEESERTSRTSWPCMPGIRLASEKEENLFSMSGG